MNQPQLSLGINTPLFVGESGLPWLKADPGMQHPAAFIGLTVYDLADYAPMARHFPAGCTIAMKRVHSCDELTEGVYFAQRKHSQPNYPDYHRVQFGRFAGLSETSDLRAQARRTARGRVHFELLADVLPTDPRSQALREDGSAPVYMDFNLPDCELWRVTHYVNLPTWALNSLGRRAEDTGTTPDQARWLKEEQLIELDSAYEFTTRVLGGFPEPDCRAVLNSSEHGDFNCLWNSLPKLKPSEAKKRKSGAVAISWRSTGPCKTSVSCTEYHKREDAALLIGWLQNVADIHRATGRAAQHRDAVAAAAQGIRAVKKASCYTQEPTTGKHVPAEVAREELAEAA